MHTLPYTDCLQTLAAPTFEASVTPSVTPLEDTEMSFISGKQVEIKKAVQPDDIKAILHERIDWEYKYGVWCTVTDVCKAIGIEPSHKNLIHAGHAIREIMPDVMERRSNSKKLILIPCRIIDEPTSGS